MYNIISFIEKATRYLRTQIKIFYWKLKYGKRLKIGKNLRFRKGLIINISKNGYLEIGDNCFFNNYCSINCHKKILIGDNNIFGENVKLYDHNHIFNDKTKNIAKSYINREIIIHNRNWFGSNAIILSKTTVGSNNVFSANSTINQKIENNRLIRNSNKIEIENITFRKNDDIL